MSMRPEGFWTRIKSCYSPLVGMLLGSYIIISYPVTLTFIQRDNQYIYSDILFLMTNHVSCFLSPHKLIHSFDIVFHYMYP